VTGIESSSAWKNLMGVPRPTSIAELFESEPDRATSMKFQLAELVIDTSKNLIDARGVDALLEVAEKVDVRGRIESLLDGAVVNNTEGRAAAHAALRRPANVASVVDGVDVSSAVHDVLNRMRAFTAAVHSGVRTGATGLRFRTVVNLGIGGSDLGPAMAHAALLHYHHPAIDCRFVSNVDPADLDAAIRGLDPATTLFVVSSKTFTTVETLANAHAARRWVSDALGEAAVGSHFVAVSTNSAEVVRFGIEESEMFPFWEWVGGRYSLASAIGLSLMLGVGSANFDELLSGMHRIDEEVRSKPNRTNAAVMMGLIGIWNRNVLAMTSKAVLPYSHDLRRFPAYLQQLEMESNGKSVHSDGSSTMIDTAPVVWGEPGTNAQHAFMQLLHQGTTVVPVDFIGFAKSATPVDDRRHETLFLNMLAQARALAFGRSIDDVAPDANAPHRVFPGSRPSTTIVAARLTPSVLGQLVALYEWVVFVQGVAWGINSFDQFGVELGKEMALGLAESSTNHRDTDPSTHSLLSWFRSTVDPT
jgi:glucose-6-phosphate isomerase